MDGEVGDVGGGCVDTLARLAPDCFLSDPSGAVPFGRLANFENMESSEGDLAIPTFLNCCALWASDCFLGPAFAFAAMTATIDCQTQRSDLSQNGDGQVFRQSVNGGRGGGGNRGIYK